MVFMILRRKIKAITKTGWRLLMNGIKKIVYWIAFNRALYQLKVFFGWDFIALTIARASYSLNYSATPNKAAPQINQVLKKISEIMKKTWIFKQRTKRNGFFLAHNDWRKFIFVGFSGAKSVQKAVFLIHNLNIRAECNAEIKSIMNENSNLNSLPAEINYNGSTFK